MIPRGMPSNRNDPTAFSTYAKRKNNVGPRKQGQGRQGFKDGRKGGCFNCNRFGHYVRECSNKMDTPRDDDHNHNNFKGNGNQRNNRFKGKRNAPTTRYGNDRPTKKSRNSRYEETNVVDKKKEFYLISALTIASPPDTLEIGRAHV